MGARPSRRSLLGALAIGAGGVGAGAVVGRVALDDETDRSEADVASPTTEAKNAPVAATGRHQAGIATPATPQPFSLTLVADVPDPAVLSFLPPLGETLLEFLDDDLHDTGDLTVTVGVGPRIVAGVDAGLPGAEPLPEFVGDTELAPERTGGDLLLIASASDPAVLPSAVSTLLRTVPGAAERWRQFGFRGPDADGVVRNPFGFHDGIAVPRGEEELGENVWLRNGRRTAGGTIAVIRRLRTDIEAFAGLSVDEQEAVVGRKRVDGAPLSGGERMSEVNLTARTADGRYVTPIGSHARAAHPGPTGSALMLRRGYSYAEGDEVGLVFTCFQRDLRTFVATQQRLDEQDQMMRFVTTTASAGFLVLPGFDRNRPLGATLSEAT
ncbi:Dyp-type peroxidase [Phytoactinopolyspora endophytica]|uniref:Dyp-type peroxidase n=1 Tax=Phytoactinopolyspora endophytica TaxID=1642495 RepID=UPI00197BA607|nr:Dyp-type peroxidase [Phytoactinopolyspora endophytica]